LIDPTHAFLSVCVLSACSHLANRVCLGGAKLKKLKGRAMTILPPMGAGLVAVKVRGAEATLRVPT
jgi:hypothetical protein